MYSGFPDKRTNEKKKIQREHSHPYITRAHRDLPRAYSHTDTSIFHSKTEMPLIVDDGFIHKISHRSLVGSACGYQGCFVYHAPLVQSGAPGEMLRVVMMGKQIEVEARSIGRVRNSKKRTGEKERDREVVHYITNIPSRFQQFSGREGPKPCRREDGVRKVSKYRDGCTEKNYIKFIVFKP